MNIIKSLIEEDLEIVKDDIYLSSQTIRHDNNNYESIFNAGKKRVYIIIKLLSYKAKLIF